VTATPPWDDARLTRQQRGDMAFRYQDWLLTKNVPNGSFRLLYAILQCLNDENQFHCFPSIETLAARIKRAPQTVWEMLPKLEKLGVIEIEWGSQGSGHSNTYRLPAAFLEFYFGPEKGRLPKLDPAPRKHRQAGVSKHRQAEVSGAPETQVQPSENSGLTPKKHRPACESHLEPPISHKKERGSAARTFPAVRDSINNSTADDAPLNPAKTTADDAPNSEPVVSPVPRAEARTEPNEHQSTSSPPIPSRQSSHRDSPRASIGRPPNAAHGERSAVPAVFERGREVLGDGSDALVARLLDAEHALDALGAAERVLDALNAAANEDDPHGHIENAIEIAESLDAPTG
jgi:hypothetical protein